MANRTWHLGFGIFTYIAFIIIWYIYVGLHMSDSLWVLLGFGISVFGAELPDFDQVYEKVFDHRDILTHSFLIVGVITIVGILFCPPAIYQYFAPMLVLLQLGNSSHFLLDLFPVYKGRAPVEWVIDGVTGSELKNKFAGTYLIKLPFHIKDPAKQKGKPKLRRSFNKIQTRLWLFFNGAVIGGILIYLTLLPIL